MQYFSNHLSVTQCFVTHCDCNTVDLRENVSCASYWVVVLIRCLVRLLGTLYTSPSQVAEKVSFLCCLAAYNSSACCRGLASLVGGLCLPRVCSFFVRHAVDMFFSAMTGCWGKSRAFPLHQFSQWLGFAVEVLYLFTVIHRK